MLSTSSPSAPAPFRALIISQKCFSGSTVCTEHHSSSASGRTVGLLIPGSTASTSASFALGTFIRMYFLPSAAFTASMRKRSSSRISCFSALNEPPLPISTASDCSTVSTSARLLLTSVLPDDTMSKMASESPMPGAISTEPEITCTSAVIPRSRMKSISILG